MKKITKINVWPVLSVQLSSVGMFTVLWNVSGAFPFCRFKALYPFSWVFTPRLAPVRMVLRAVFPVRDFGAIISACFRWALASFPITHSSSSLSSARIDFVPFLFPKHVFEPFVVHIWFSSFVNHSFRKHLLSHHRGPGAVLNAELQRWAWRPRCCLLARSRFPGTFLQLACRVCLLFPTFFSLLIAYCCVFPLRVKM